MPTESSEKFQYEKSTEFSSNSQNTSGDMAVAFRRGWFDRDLFPRHRDSTWARDDWLDELRDWPTDWPKPRELFGRFIRDTDNWWHDWPSSWPRMDAVMPRFTAHLDRMDSNWRGDPFWKDLYPVWAEPIFKEGIDVNSSITNDEQRFAVSIDAYQFRPEEITVKTLDDTLMVEGRHEEVRDRDNYTKMHFVRKYQLPADVHPGEISSSIDAKGRLTVEAQKRAPAITARERVIPIEGTSKYQTGSGSRTRYDSGYSNGHSSSQSAHRTYSPVEVDTRGGQARNVRIEHESSRASSRGDYRGEARGDYRGEARDLRGETRDIRGESRDLRDYREERERGLRSGSRGDQLLTREHELGEGGRGAGYRSEESYYKAESRGTSGGAVGAVGGLSPHNVTSGNENRQYTNGRRASFENTGFRSHSRGAEVREEALRDAREAREEAHQRAGYQSGFHQSGYQRESESRNASAATIQIHTTNH